MENPQTTTSSMTTAAATTDEEAASAIWNWETLFDFSVAAEDDPFITFPWSTVDSVGDPPQSPTPPSAAAAAFVPGPSADPVSGAPDRVRKRDPRLTCSNFLAGRIPCACPEEDAKEAEEEEAAAVAEGRVVKKRVRKGTAGSNVRCQVPGCEADISELKGYHRRHRVCLTCANAASVILDGIHMRYCQQCGKFHILPDFDEGKRSCRRKLERHNKRRRRRSTHTSNTLEKEKGVQLPAEDVICAGETDIDSPCPGNKSIDAELILESDDGDVSPICSIPSICNVQSNSAASFAASGGIPKEEGVDISKLTIVSSSGDDKIGYSSMCPTGRLSFKLYDWNPAEFPRRLRHQIFQWLASMPVELEGYIRPGCTILTVFIAMPCYMWDKLSRHAAEYLNDFIHGPQSVLSGKGTVLIYLNNMIYEVLEDGTSLMNIKMEVQVPRLHYVYPTFFEAGKPMDFIVCGNNLLQPKLQFLVSFAGKYLPCDCSLAVPHGKKSHVYHGSEEDSFGSLEHEIFRIHVPHTDAKLFGPAFIEVENESGLSNFIPVLVGDKPLCSDLQILQSVFNGSLELENFVSKLIDVNIVPDLCNVCMMRQREMSELLLDIAWLLQEPLNDNREAHWTSVHVQRMICVLKFLIKHRSISILEKILNSWKLIMDKKIGYPMDRVVEPNSNLLQECIACARGMVCQKLELDNNSELDLKKSGDIDMLSNSPTTVKGGEVTTENGSSSATTTSCEKVEESVAFLSNMVAKRQECYPSILQGFQWSEKGCGHARPSIFTKPRLAILLMVSVAMCFGICITLFHPHKAGEYAVSVRKCVLGSFEP